MSSTCTPTHIRIHASICSLPSACLSQLGGRGARVQLVTRASK